MKRNIKRNTKPSRTNRNARSKRKQVEFEYVRLDRKDIIAETKTGILVNLFDVRFGLNKKFCYNSDFMLTFSAALDPEFEYNVIGVDENNNEDEETINGAELIDIIIDRTDNEDDEDDEDEEQPQQKESK